MTEEIKKPDTADTSQTSEQSPEAKKQERVRKPRPTQLPPPTFPQLVDTFFLQAMISLGKQMNPVTQKYERNLAIAQYQIDILEVLQQKTKGNLTKDEEDHLENVLHTARMAYVDEAQKEVKE